MAIKRNGTLTKYAFLHNGNMLKKGYHNSNTLIWSAGAVVTYMVDIGVSYDVEVTSGEDVLNPTSFTPALSGWEFVGWREDSAASNDVLSSKTMESDPITLYAVFKKTCTLTAISYDSTQKLTDDAYYNNGNFANASVTIPTGASYTGWAWRGWSAFSDVSANANVAVANGQVIDIGTSDGTIYGLYEKTCTLTCVSYNNTQTVEGKAYFNAAGNSIGANVIAPAGATFSGMNWRGWSSGGQTAANADVAFAIGATVGLGTSDHTIYGLYEQTVTVSYYHVSNSTKQTATGTKYYNAAGNTKNPTFTINPSGYGSEWTFRGWTTDTAADASVTYSAINDTEIIDDVTLYILLQRPVTISFNGNGATSGSVASQTEYLYLNSYNANTEKAATFTLPANGFARTNKYFVAWGYSSASGDQYAPGASISLNANITFFAVWQQLYTAYTIGAFQNYNWTWSTPNGTGGGYEYEVRADKLYIYAEKTGGNDACGQYAATLPTQGCNKMRVKYDAGIYTNPGNKALIQGVEVATSNVTDGYAYFSIDENATSIWFTAQAWSGQYEEVVTLTIEEIYFYYE